MKRQVTMEEISDGKLYTSNDLVKADCGDCKGCHACCTGMGSSIVLDPLDIVRICRGTGTTFETLLAGKIELNVVDGIILPNLKMAGEEEGCGFLTKEGRCSIHPFRPGICRLFPLGRYYEENGFRYFLQVHECKKELDTPNLKDYETYIARWHGFLIQLQEYIAAHPESAKAVSMGVLQRFYLTPYQTEEFYSEFFRRMDEAKKIYC